MSAASSGAAPSRVQRVKRRVVRSADRQRARAAAVRLYSEREVRARRVFPEPRRSGRVLCYHSVGQPEMGVNDVAPDRFRHHIEWALDAGFRFVAPWTIASTGGGPADIAITFDDAPVSVGTIAAPILREHGIPFSVFVVTSWTDEGRSKYMSWDALADLAASGVEIGSHSVSHRRFPTLDRNRTEEELERSRARIAERLGHDVVSFAIPFGQSGDWSEEAMACARAAGYSTVYAQAEHTRPAGTVGRTFITRFDNRRVFHAALSGAFDDWEEWY